MKFLALRGIKTITTDLDHYLIIMTLKTAGEVTWQEAGVKRCYHNFNKDGYLMDIKPRKLHKKV